MLMKIFSKEKISWMLRRHPMLYYFRYAMISVNFKGKSTDDLGCFNDLNDITDVPKIYFETNPSIPIAAEMDDFAKAQAIARFLRNNTHGGKGLSLSSGKTLEKMFAGEGGVCSDFSQVFNTFCLVNNIKVKEWSCVDRFYKSNFGHTFNEIYSSEHQKWIAIDAGCGIYFTNADGVPLSVIELFKYLRSGNKLQYVFFGDYIHPNADRIKGIYSCGAMPFLIINYKNHETDYFLNKFDGIPSFIVNTMLIFRRKHFQFVFVLDNYKIKLLPKYFQDLAAD